MSARSRLTDDQLEAFLRARAMAPDVGLFDEIMGSVDGLPQRRAGWLSMPSAGRSRSALVLVAAALLVAFAAGAIAIGSGLVKLPSVLPSPSVVIEPSAEESPSRSAEASPAEPLRLVVYNVVQPVDPLPATCTASVFHPGCQEMRIWAANSAGTPARELFPDVPGNQWVIAWSPDAASLLYADDRGLVLTDLAGSDRQRLPRALDQAGDSADFSPDGTRLALADARHTDQGEVSVIAIYDLATKQITDIESIRTHFDPNTDCTTAAQEGANSSPRWSPDGTRLLVTRGQIGPHDDSGNCRSIVFSVNADGSDFQLVMPSDGRNEPADASWSPDGSWVVFPTFTFSGPGDAEGACNIHIVRPDGSNHRALTSDGVSCWPTWTRDGRIVFRKWLDPQRNTYDLWITDTNGGNLTRLRDSSIAALTSVGCVECPSPQDANFGDTNGGTGGAVLWQPIDW